MVTHWSILYHFIGCFAPRYVMLHPPSTIAIPSLSLGAKNFLPRKRTYPHLSKGFNWLQLKTSSPHHCVGFLFFALHPPLLPLPVPLPLCAACHTSLITAQLITPLVTAQLITPLCLAGAALTPPHHTALITPLVTAQLIITPLVTAQLTHHLITQHSSHHL